jgi:hypothetical protein
MMWMCIVVLILAFAFPWFATLFKWCFAVPFLGASLGAFVWSITGLFGAHMCSTHLPWEQLISCEAHSMGVYVVCGILFAAILMFKVK